jgi:hypothetical protein
MLAQALREAGRTAEWRLVLRDLSVAREVSVGLARYLTVFVPCVGGQGSLLSHSLGRALDAWQEGTDARNSFDRYHAFLRGLLEPVPEVLEWAVRVCGPDGESYWDPMVSGLLQFWRDGRGVVEVIRRQRPRDSTYVDIAPADLRFLVLVRFLTHRELRLAPLAPRFNELVCRYG